MKLSGRALFLGLMVALARSTTVSDFGVVQYGLTLVQLLAPICSLGYERISLRFGSVYWNSGEYALLRGLFTHARVLTLAVSLGLAAAVLAIHVLVAPQDTDGRWTAVLFAAAIIPLWSLALLHQNLLRGIGLLKRALTGFQLLRPTIGLATLGVLVVAFGRPLSVATVSTIFLVSLGLNILYDQVNIRRSLASTGPDRETRYAREEWNGVARPLLWSKLALGLAERSDILVLGMMASMASTAQYAAALRLAAVTAAVLDAVRFALAPRISSLFAENAHKELQDQLSLASNWIFLFSLPVAALLLAAPGPILGVFGEEYRAGAPVLQILVLGQLVNAWSGVAGPVLTMTVHERLHSRLITGSTVLHLVAVAVGTATLGPVGTALGVVVGVTVRSGLFVYACKKQLGLLSYFSPRRLDLPGMLSGLRGMYGSDKSE